MLTDFKNSFSDRYASGASANLEVVDKFC